MSGGGKKDLSNYLSQPFDIWYTAFTLWPIPWDSISGMSLFHFLFIDLVKFSTLMVNGRTSQPHDIWYMYTNATRPFLFLTHF
jgi:hypothetical protein